MNKVKIKHEGVLDLGNGITIPCYVLEDGTRVLSGRGMQNALNIAQTVGKKEVQKAGGELARFLTSKWFNTLIANKYGLEHFAPTICYKGDQKINGYEATKLVDLCDAILEARTSGATFSERNQSVAAQCEILVRSFAKVGIIALVDEATGYQYDREKLELQSILKTFISAEILKWQETFQLSFYKEIFRLWGVPFTPENIKRKPMFIGKLTNELVYKNMPKGTFVLDVLKEKTPKTEAGHYKYRLHQSLTAEVGREALKKVIYSIETLASISEDKRKFLKLVEDKYGQKEIPFGDLEEVKEAVYDENEISPFNQKLKKALDFNPGKKQK